MAAEQLELECASTTATFPLNYDCLFNVFQWLDLEECMNLAEAYEGLQPVADWTYKRKFNVFTFDFGEPIDRVLYHAGPTVKSLSLFFDQFKVAESDVVKIRDTCKELQCLTLNRFDRKRFGSKPFGKANDQLEVLTLNHCSFVYDKDFLETSGNLKSLNLYRCRGTDNIAVKKCFEKNQGIKSFTFDSKFHFYPQLLQLLPNLERLSLRYDSRRMNLNWLSKIQSLRHLTLLCTHENVNDILVDLVKVNILEELVLIDVSLDEKTFALIKSFQNLQLLVITTYNYKLPPSSEALPITLRTLKLGGFQIAANNISSIVKQLKYLEDVHLQECNLVANGELVGYVDEMTDLILEELSEYAYRQLTIVLTSFFDQSPENFVESGKLTVINCLENPNIFEILYPDGRDEPYYRV